MPSTTVQTLADRIAIASGVARLSELPVERRLAVIIEKQERTNNG